MKYKGIIFDLDGTLIDSMWIWEQIDIDFLIERGHDLPSDLQKDIEGCSFTETATYFKSRFNLVEDVETIKNIWIDMATDYYQNKIKLKKGIQILLDRFKKDGLKIAVATSNSRILAEHVLKSNGIFEYFDVIITSCDVNKGKPEPDVFLKAAELMNLSPETCLVFEDTHAGVLGAKAAGMDVTAIYDEISEPYKKVIEADADYYIECFTKWV
jgi:HAD superfamily hydrolase (TIGR01509 family)